MQGKNHWETVYSTKSPTDVSWFQSHPTKSLAFIEKAGLASSAALIDIGGGASVLVDCLLEAGFERPAVLDISRNALEHARRRLGERAADVDWHESDVTDFRCGRRFDLWHDRAVFHFLREEDQRRRYVETLSRHLKPGGHVIIATFAPDGPAQCSGLDVMRYDADRIAAELSDGYQLIDAEAEDHVTPAERVQHFNYFLFRHRA